MHRSARDLLEIDPEIERTLLARRRLQFQRQQEANANPIMADQGENRPLREYAASRTRGLRSSIRRPPIEANNFEVKPGLLSMVQQHQFGGALIEDSETQWSFL